VCMRLRFRYCLNPQDRKLVVPTLVRTPTTCLGT
jgi:hypothetical protein